MCVYMYVYVCVCEFLCVCVCVCVCVCEFVCAHPEYSAAIIGANYKQFSFNIQTLIFPLSFASRGKFGLMGLA